MNIEQVGLQLGIAGLLVFVGWKIATLLIEKWNERWTQHITSQEEAEARRAQALAVGLSSIVDRVDRHAATDLHGHTEIASRVARFEAQLEVIIGWQERTPVEGTPIIGAPSRRQTPAAGTAYGLKRPPTKGG